MSDEHFYTIYGVSEQEAVEHYTNKIARRMNERRKNRLDEVYRKYVKVPIVTEGIRLDTVMVGENGDFIYNYVQTIATRPRLRKVDIVLSGDIYESDRKLYAIPESSPLTFYISSVSGLADRTEHYMTKIIERHADANMTSRIDFQVGKSNIDLNLGDNRRELGRIRRTLTALLENEEFLLDSIIVTASASPEGSESLNWRLSRSRSESISRYLDDQNEIDKLHKQVEKMNEGLETLKTIIYEMGARGYIVGVEEGTDEYGRAYYKLKFRTITPDADGRGYEMTDDKDPVLLYTGVDGKDGKDAEPYVVSAKQDEEDGRWYWYSVQDEDWLKDDQGNRFPVDGKTPQLKVEEGFWFLSWDDGQNWEETGWKAKGEDAYEMFTKVEVFDDRVELTLTADGSVLVLPRFLPVDVVLTVNGQNPDKDIMIYPGETISVHYVLSGTGVADAILVAGTDGRLKTAIREDSATEGTVYVTCPKVKVEDFPKGSYVSITVNDGNGRSDVRILRFACRFFDFLLGEREHTAPAAGETGVELSFMTDFDLDIICVEPFLSSLDSLSYLSTYWLTSASNWALAFSHWAGV